MRKLFVLLSLLIVLSMVFAACAPAPEAPATEAPQQPAQTEEPAATEPPAETEELPRAQPPKTRAPSFRFPSGEPDLLDPAYDYETAGGEVLQNVYETLVTYKGNFLSEFEPQLADPGKSLRMARPTPIKLVQWDVKFHDGADMTASDVVYSFVRGMLQGGADSPQFLIIEPFYGVGTTDISEMVEVAQGQGLEALAEGVSTEE